MTKGIFRAVALAAALSPALAAAQGACPQGTARDGVWLEFPDRTVHARVLSDGRIAETEYIYEDGAIFGYITLPLGLVLDGWTLVAGRVPPADRERVTYQGTPPQVPLPVPGARFDGIETARFADGGQIRYAVTAAVGDPRPVQIGPCRYTGLPVDVTRVEEGGPAYRDSMMHLSELGVTLYLGFSEDGSVPVPDFPISISTEPPLAGSGPPAPGSPAPPPLPPAPGGAAPAPAK